MENLNEQLTNEGFIENVDKCIICGAIIPEGSQVCIRCQMKENEDT